MDTLYSPRQGIPSGEPKLIIPALAPLYGQTRDLSWLIIRLAAGGDLLVHGIVKLMGPGVAAFATGSLARRGIEPALAMAYIVFFLETVGAVMIITGLLTRVMAAIIAVEFAIITFVAHYPNGYAFARPGGGWEFPFMWGILFFAIALRGGGPYSLDRKIGWEI
jgi:putative oxidoreductase